MLSANRPGNYVLGAGSIYLKEDGSDKWRYLAESPELTVTIESTKQELYSSDSRKAEKLEDVTTQVDRTGAAEFHQIDRDTLRYFFAGEVTDEVESGSSANTETFEDVELGTYIQLGDNDASAPPQGWRNVSTVSVEADPAGTPVSLTLGDDYELDAKQGMIHLLAGAVDLDDGDTIEVTYDVDAATTEVIKTSDNVSTTAALKYISNNTKGDERDYIFPHVDFSPSGEVALKSRDTFMALPMEFSILDPESADVPAIIIVGESKLS